MSRVVASAADMPDDAEALLGALSRLRREVEAANSELDRIEAELRNALNDLARERFKA